MPPSQLAAALILAVAVGACAQKPAGTPAEGAAQAERNPFVYEGPKTPGGFFCRDLTPLQRGWLPPRWGCTEVFRPGD
jgi:hypothetical protein